MENTELHGGADSLLQSAFLALEAGQWDSARQYCDQVLAGDSENGQAYLGKLMAELRVSQKADLQNCRKPFDDRENYKNILRYGDDALVDELTGYISHILSQSRPMEMPSKPEKDSTKIKSLVTTVISGVMICAVIAVVLFVWIIPGIKNNNAYKAAVALMEAGKYNEAISAFEQLGNFRDSSEKIEQCIAKIKYNEALALKNSGDNMDALDAFGAMGDNQDAKAQIRAIWDGIAQRNSLCIGAQHTMGLRGDGTVVVLGDNGHGQCNVTDWNNIIDITADGWHSVGLKNDGAVVASGDNSHGQCDVSGWTDIVAIAAGPEHTVGLRDNSTVIATGSNTYGQCNVTGWTDVVAISASEQHTVGLKEDGTVVAVGNNEDGRCDVAAWADIIAISADNTYTAGLRSDGTVVIAGDVSFDVSDWTDITAIATGDAHIVGLKSDGTVVAAGDNQHSQCKVSQWTDIVAICAGTHHTMALRSDGTVIAVGFGQDSLNKIAKWTNIKS